MFHEIRIDFPGCADEKAEDDEANEGDDAQPLLGAANSNSQVHQRKTFCKFCKANKPPRSKHCHVCGHCIVRFDHHCPGVGVCVGGQNHARFLAYIFSQGIACAIGVNSGAKFIGKIDSLGLWFFHLAFLLFLAIMSLFTLGLSVFHIYLAFTNQTTYDLMLADRRRVEALVAGLDFRTASEGANHDNTTNEENSAKEKGVNYHEEDLDYDEGICLNLFWFFAGETRDRYCISPTTIVTI